MNLKKNYIIVLVAVFMLGSAGIVTASQLGGVTKISYLYLDEDGNRGVNQSTFNVYEGFGLSLEKLSYVTANGTRFYGNLKDITLNNRNMVASVTRSGLFGLTLSNNQYRRTYTFDGDVFTRRNHTNGQVWVQAQKNVRLFGGYGYTDRHGQVKDLFARTNTTGLHEVDYTNQYYNGGVRLKFGQRLVNFDYRGNNFNDDLDTTNDRKSRRIRIAGISPLPIPSHIPVRVLLNGGYQYYQNKLTNRSDTLTAYTTWGGLKVYSSDGYSLKYTFIWDRAARSGDLTATDNISNAVYLGKTWRRQGGLTVGYRSRTKDDVWDKLATKSFFVSGWKRISQAMMVRAGLGSQRKDVDAGNTLTGDRDYTNYWTTLRYQFDTGPTIRVRFEDKQIDNDDIGSSVEFTRISTEVTLDLKAYGDFRGSYDYSSGKYENWDGEFKYDDHALNGDVTSREYKDVILAVGGTYRKSKNDLDVESFSLRLKGTYAFLGDHLLEVKYSAYNFDDLANIAPLYTQYYTANIVQVSVAKQF